LKVVDEKAMDNAFKVTIKAVKYFIFSNFLFFNFANF
jgi:hypothetical protein